MEIEQALLVDEVVQGKEFLVAENLRCHDFAPSGILGNEVDVIEGAGARPDNIGKANLLAKENVLNACGKRASSPTALAHEGEWVNLCRFHY